MHKSAKTQRTEEVKVINLVTEWRPERPKEKNPGGLTTVLGKTKSEQPTSNGLTHTHKR